MTPDSGPRSAFPPTTIAIGDEDEPPITTRAAIAEALTCVTTPLVLLTGESTPPDTEVEAMSDVLRPGGWVARAVGVTDALKTVEAGMITGVVDRGAVVSLRLPILVPTGLLYAVVDGAGEVPFDVVDALARVGTAIAYIRT